MYRKKQYIRSFGITRSFRHPLRVLDISPDDRELLYFRMIPFPLLLLEAPKEFFSDICCETLIKFVSCGFLKQCHPNKAFFFFFQVSFIKT